ncbi:hypothetical protein LCGC14_2468050 [marine sediment metagenome]|uniref:Phage gp6-like head-tail connector protein n=1 Tax=marine sediment metagenome TaxID=412755 RepID=A0A0F9BZ04_9ZZZZ
MADITNGYATLAEFKTEKDISSTDAVDDTSIEDIIEAASRFIDSETGRTFYARTETRNFDVPRGTRELRLDDDLLTITTLTNGDDNEIANTEYILLPANVSPKFAIVLKSTSSTIWQPDSNSGTEQVISVAGTWGWVADHPDNIKRACLMIATDYYDKREGQGVTTATVTGAGVVIKAAGVPAAAMKIIRTFRKLT